MSGIENKIQPRKECPESGLESLSVRSAEVQRIEVEPHREEQHLSTIDLSLARPEMPAAPEHESTLDFDFGSELEMLPAREYVLEEKVSKVEAAQGVKGRSFGFRGHSGGSRTVLDRVVTLIADFIKKIEVKLFRWLDRRRVERLNRKLGRSAVNVVLPEDGPIIPKTKKKKSLLGLLIGWER